MPVSRYSESRTLVRPLARLPHEERQDVTPKVARLRRHFERFNVDVAELCQWLMGLRNQFGPKESPASFGPLGDFLIEPALDNIDADETERDRWRLAVFDAVAGFRPIRGLGDHPVPDTLRLAMQQAASLSPTPTTARLLERLRPLSPAHRLVLLKSAAEWIVARYQRGMENWVIQHAAWHKEKEAWEREHPALTPAVRERFTALYKQLSDSKPTDRPVSRRKNPRICEWERLRQNIDNCCYAGEKGHGPLCRKYANFVKARKAVDGKFNDLLFWDTATSFIALCRKFNVTRARNALQSQHVLDALFAEDQRRKAERDQAKGRQPRPLHPQAAARAKSDFLRIFKDGWNAYLSAMGLNDSTAIEKGRLPHCQKIGGTFENSKCEWNPHTDLCNQYRRLAGQLDDATLALEKDYREWRRLYLAGPRKPSFQYPSSRDLPMPKIFGAGFFELDMDRSILRLRLDDMVEGEWLEFGFKPWPREYTPSRAQVARPGRITSVHVNFIGSRCRVGFRFEAPHAGSRFGCSQDEIDQLRRDHPRERDDQPFLEAARKRLVETFAGDARRDLRLLAVDVGEKGCCAAVYQGTRYVADALLPIIKINQLYTEPPTELKPDSHNRPAPDRRPFNDEKDPRDPRGVRKEHVARHLKHMADKAPEVAAYRLAQREKAAPSPSASPPPVTLGVHDFRRLKRHVTWMIRDWARHNAARIVAEAQRHGCDLIVFESHRGRRPPGYHEVGDDAERRKLDNATFAFGRIRRKVTEKAVERGLRVVTVPYHCSSKVCSRCGRLQENDGLLRRNKKERKFICEQCKFETNSDGNAARVLARVFWGEIMLPSPEERRKKREGSGGRSPTPANPGGLVDAPPSRRNLR